MKKKAEKADDICGAIAEACKCHLPSDHYPTTPHECDPRYCSGSWDDYGDGEFYVVRWPVAPGDVAIGAMLGMPIPQPGNPRFEKNKNNETESG